MNEEQRAAICSAAVQLMAHVGYVNAGTVEFLVEGDQFYFIEVNPRVQVEHTITEMITDIDIVISQLQIAQGLDLHKDMHLPKQNELTLKARLFNVGLRLKIPEPVYARHRENRYVSFTRWFWCAFRCRECLFWLRCDSYFDSLLVKVCTHGFSFEQAISKMQRCLKEFRIRGVKTNIPFYKML